MSFHVALVDKSEIIKKMLSHCLYYFSADVLRFDQLRDIKNHFSDKNPDIIFMDWDVGGGEEAVSSAINEVQPTPMVLLYRSEDEVQISSTALNLPHKIKKPLDPKAVRDVFTKLVPQAKDSKIHPFLKFPKSSVKKESAPTQEAPSSSHLKGKPVAGEQDKKDMQKPFPEVSTKPTPAKERLSHTSSAIAPEQPVKKTTDVLSPIANKAFSIHRSSPRESVDLANKKNLSGKKIDKENINIDENTQNDLAPMAIKSESDLKRAQDIKNWKLSEKDILRVLNKYKDSLEFQELMEGVLSEYAKKTVTNILQGDKVVDLLRQPLNEFKEGEKFKALVEKEIIQYVRKNLPILLKEVVEQEIKKIIGD